LRSAGRKDSRGLLNDRGLAKFALRDYQGAIADFSQAITLGCAEDDFCPSFENRADAYVQTHDYVRAISDIGVSIKRILGYSVFLINIDQFRWRFWRYRRGAWATAPKLNNRPRQTLNWMKPSEVFSRTVASTD
jgi:hypothetical protein